jgi:hypothetical protein
LPGAIFSSRNAPLLLVVTPFTREESLVFNKSTLALLYRLRFIAVLQCLQNGLELRPVWSIPNKSAKERDASFFTFSSSYPGSYKILEFYLNSRFINSFFDSTSFTRFHSAAFQDFVTKILRPGKFEQLGGK